MTATTTTNERMARSATFTGPIASRHERMKAALIDAGILLAANAPIYLCLWMFGVWQFFLMSLVITAGASATIFLTINYNSLKTMGQTIGKQKLNIRIVSRDDQPVDVDTLLLKRYAPLWLVSLIPYVGPILCLASVLFIFRESHACLHDDIANTKVVPV